MTIPVDQRILVFKMIVDEMLLLSSDKNNNSDYGLIDFVRYGLPRKCFWNDQICFESYEESTLLPGDNYLPSPSTPIDQSPSPTALIQQSPSKLINHSPLTPIDQTSLTPIDQSPHFPPSISPGSSDVDHPLLEQEVKIHTIMLPENVLGIPASKAEEKLGHMDRELATNLAANGNVHSFNSSNFDLYELMRIYLFDTGDNGLIFPPPMIPLNNCSLGEENFPSL